MLSLFLKRRFTPLFITQFGGAMNDNIYKNAFAVLLVYKLAAEHGYDAKILVTITQAIFILPYILFAAIAGSMGDIYDKALIIRWVKALEIGIVLLAVLAFYAQDITLLMVIVFLLSVQSTFFGPVKYSIIPHHIPQHLVNANALITAGTFLAIIGGTIIGGYFAATPNGILIIDIILVVVAIGGFLSARFIPAAPPVNLTSPNAQAVSGGKKGNKGKKSNKGEEPLRLSLNPITTSIELISCIMGKRRELIPLLLGVSWFWFLGSTLLTQIPVLTGTYLRVEGISVSMFMVMFACGIGLGAILCSFLMKGKATSRYATMSSLLMGIMLLETVFAARAAAASSVALLSSGEEYIALGDFISDWRAVRLCIDFTLVSILGGFYVLPIFALLQEKAQPQERARVIATNNIMNATFMVSAALLTILLYLLGGDLYLLFECLAGICFVVSILWWVRGFKTKKTKQALITK